ncbi:MAG: polyprenyl synthetase family protein [Acidobacteriota bacterium]|nr:polyprenyl synthetase family protein [Acidobacteriota bacterium]MDE3170868.1 polyprenyl synthetase family protein [Acidobacteriota bacterium]
MTTPDFFQADHSAIEAALERALPSETTPPETIHRAMRYSVFAGGKRVRPILCLEAARMFNDNLEGAIRAGCALEFIHTYSLIHDDLPALDNDDLRRGKATNHKVFGEAMAILAGDGLLTLAFETLANAPIEPAQRVRVISEVGAAAGTIRGMVGGQVADVEAGGKAVDAATLEYIHRSKTAALIRGSIVAGAIAGGAADADVERLRRFGDLIGWAFQVVDDILDVEESSAALGKTAGKDQEQQKATYAAYYGLQKSRSIAADLETRALKELEPFGGRANRLKQLAQFLVARRS